MLTLLFAMAHANYGVPVDGHPSAAERAVHVWTNAVRMSPEDYSGLYIKADNGQNCFGEFLENELQPLPPLAQNNDLNEVARFHSWEMDHYNFFSHDSAPQEGGLDAITRIQQYYNGGAIGENIAYGYPGSRDAVVSGWMCSAGHRANIMLPNFDEMGAGVIGVYYTQNFGGGGVKVPVLSMGAHEPVLPSNTKTLLVNVYNPGAGEPDSAVMVINGEPIDLFMAGGEPDFGTYFGDIRVDEFEDEAGCVAYYFEASWGSDTYRFPEAGEYGIGDCEWTDSDAEYIGSDASDGPGVGGPGTTDFPGGKIVGCNTSGAPVGALALLPLLGLRRRR